MKIRAIGVIMLLMVLIGSCAAIVSATPPVLDELKYYNDQDNFCVKDLEGNINLELVYTEMNTSAIKIERIWYDSGTNKTTYRFTTQKTYVEWWFTPDVKKFVFLDNTSNLYQINIDYSNITIPENPYEERHQQITENYTMLLNDYNLTNETLFNITIQYNTLNDLYNWTSNQLSEKGFSLTAIELSLANVTKELNDKKEEYNTTHIAWIHAIENATIWQLNYEGLSDDFNQLEDDHNNLSGAMPWYIIITVIGTFLFTYIYIRRKNIFEVQPEQTDEITTGYGKIHARIDNFILGLFRKNKTEDTNEKIEEIKDYDAPEEKTPSENKPQEDILTMVHEKIDANNRDINTKIDNLSETIDKMIKDRVDEKYKKE